MAQQFFVRRGNRENGPLTIKELSQLAASGELAATDLVRDSQNRDDWRQAGAISGVFRHQDVLPEAYRIAGPKPFDPDNQLDWWERVFEANEELWSDAEPELPAHGLAQETCVSVDATLKHVAQGDGTPQTVDEQMPPLRESPGHHSEMQDDCDFGTPQTADDDVERDCDHGIQLLQQAAKEGRVDAQYHLGIAYRNGDGVPKDEGEAVRWLYLAAKQNNGWAVSALWELIAPLVAERLSDTVEA